MGGDRERDRLRLNLKLNAGGSGNSDLYKYTSNANAVLNKIHAMVWTPYNEDSKCPVKSAQKKRQKSDPGQPPMAFTDGVGAIS